MKKNLLFVFCFLIVKPTFAALQLATNPNCQLTASPSSAMAGGKVRFFYKDSIQANRLTAAYRGDKNNLSVRILDSQTGEAEYDAPIETGSNTLYVFAVNDKKQIYQRCNLSVKVAEVEYAKITQRNRYHESPAAMSGGWGPQLRSMFYGADGSKWFVHERPSETVEINQGLDYNRFDSKRGWQLAASFPVPVGIQQNMAHIADGQTIFSYGIARDIQKDSTQSSASLIECPFDMKTATPSSCKTIWAGAKETSVTSNYVGAALVPEGKLVWFITTAITGFGNGTFTYLFYDGKSWRGPVVTPLGKYDSLAYLRTSNIGNGMQVFGGEVEFAHGNLGPVVASSLMGNNYSAVVGFIDYKNLVPAKYYKLSYQGKDSEATTRVEDIYFDKVTSRVHVLAKLFPAASSDRVRNGKCQMYEALKLQIQNTLNKDKTQKSYGTMTEVEHQQLDEAGIACIQEVQKKQKLDYKYIPSLAYGSATVEEIVKQKSLAVMPQIEIQGSLARFYFNSITQELVALQSSGSLTAPKILSYAFSPAEAGQYLNFSLAKKQSYDLSGTISGTVGAIWVPGLNYSPGPVKGTSAEFVVNGSCYSYASYPSLRGDGEIYQILMK